MVTITRADESANDPLDDLAAEAQTLDGAERGDGAPADDLGGATPAPGAPVRLTNAQCVAMALQTIREAVCAIAKVQSLRRTLDDATVQTCADALGPLFDKYRIDLAGVAGDYMVEFRAVATVVPIMLAARAELLAELRARAARPVAPIPEPAPVQDAAMGADMGAAA